MVMRHRDSGVTLVELMITMVIASMVASSTFVFFAGQKQVYDTQTKLLNIQQNLWAAMETLTRNLRAAGTGMVGCVRPDPDGVVGPLAGDPAPASGPAGGPPQTGLRAFLSNARPNANALYGNGAVRIAPLWIQDGIAGRPDSLVVAYGAGTSGNFTDSRMGSIMPTGMPTSQIRTAPGFTNVFRANEFIVLLDDTAIPALGPLPLDRGCSLFQIEAINAGTNLLDTDGSASTWNPTNNVAAMVPFAYEPANAGIRNFGQLNWVRFAIDDTGGIPVLQMTRLDTNLGPQVLAEGIEDLQVAYACDLRGAAVGTPPDGILQEDGTNADEWIFNRIGDQALPVCNRPQAVRITLIARSATRDENLREFFNNGLNRKPAAENGVVGQPDMFRHRVISTTVYPRN